MQETTLREVDSAAKSPMASVLAAGLPVPSATAAGRLRAIAYRVAHARPWLKLARTLARPLPDRSYLALGYLLYFGRWPNYSKPRTFSEYTHVYMLECRDPRLHIAADKAATRDYVRDTVGERYLVPCYGVWDDPNDVPITQIDQPYVLKGTVGSGMVLFVDPRGQIDPPAVRAMLRKWLQTDYSRLHREWAYRGLPRKIIAEHALLDEHGDAPPDYKAYVIGSKVRFIQVDRGRFSQHTRNLYSRDWEPLKARLTLQNHPVDAQPARLAEMVRVAEELARPFEFLRVDFYVSPEWLYVGELTNYSGAGFERFVPESFSEELGSYWALSRR
jgi:hypothetical protein